MSGDTDRRGRLLALAGFLFAEFGPLIVFYALLTVFGLKAAIGGSVVFILADAARRRLRHIGVTRIYVLSAALTVAFGVIDISVQTPFMLSYEGVITNIALGLFFVGGARGEKPMIQEFAEKRQSTPFPVRADLIHFFRLLTLIWAGYFFLKAAAYLWLAQTMSVARAMEVRSVAGPVSLGVMFLTSAFGRQLFRLFRRLGWLPVVEDPK